MSGSRQRIAIVSDWWWPDAAGGAELAAREAAYQLAGDADVAVFVPAKRDRVYADGPLTVHATRRPFARRVHADTRLRRGLEFLSAWLLPGVAARQARRIRSFDPDVLVAHNVSRTGPWLVNWVRSRRLRFVRVYHDLSDTCWRRSRLRDDRNCDTVCGSCRLKVGLMRRATPRQTIDVCVSDFIRGQLVDAGLTTPARSLVGYPLPDLLSRPVPARRGAGVVLGYLGRLAAVKGVESAIRTAVAYRRLTGKAVSMVAAGQGRPEYLAELTALAARESIEVRFPGRVEVDAFCAEVDAVLVPSTLMEAFGRVVVEVGARGRPVLLAPVGGLPEAAAVSGGRFALADFTDPGEAARALADLLQRPLASVPGAADQPGPLSAEPPARLLAEATDEAIRRVTDPAFRQAPAGRP
jgi:glycosyltransferase involved in cell wall biosynthesis